MKSYFLFLLLCTANISYGAFIRENADAKNSFIYTNRHMGIHQRVSIDGYTPYGDKLDQALQTACLAGSAVVPCNTLINNIAIAHVQVIKILNCSQEVYNDELAYLVQTTNGLVFLYLKLKCSIQVPNGIESQNTLEVFLAPSQAGSNLYYNCGSYAGMNSLLTKLTNLQTEEYELSAWCSLLTLPDFFDNNTISLPLFKIEYSVIEESDYSNIHLINQPRQSPPATH